MRTAAGRNSPERGKVGGERAYALTGDMVLLERALLSYALDYLISGGSTVISVPVMVREEALIGTGQSPVHREETYAVPADRWRHSAIEERRER